MSGEMFYVSDVYEGESEIPGCVGMLPVFESFDMALKCAEGNEDKIGVLVPNDEGGHDGDWLN